MAHDRVDNTLRTFLEFGFKRDVMYKNDEMYNLMQALNVEDITEGLRYPPGCETLH